MKKRKYRQTLFEFNFDIFKDEKSKKEDTKDEKD